MNVMCQVYHSAGGCCQWKKLRICRGSGETSVSFSFAENLKLFLKNKVLTNLGEYVLTSVLEKTQAGMG